KALARNPKDTSALMMIGILLEKKGDFARARDAYERALAINPQHSVILNNLAYLYTVRLKQPDKGYELALKARQLLPDEPTTADTLGWINLWRGDAAGALPLLQESAAKLRNETEVLYHLGSAYYAMGDEESARAALTRAVQGDKSYVGKDEAMLKLSVLNKP